VSARDPIARGGCACGGVRFIVSGALRPVVACHCETCRRASGHHTAATAAPRDDVAVTGEVRWWRASDRARRGFCPACGSQLFWDAGAETLSIFAGSLDAPTGLTLAGHIFCAEKADYYPIADGTTCADGRDPALTAVLRG
jgi:hypothetical protein